MDSVKRKSGITKRMVPLVLAVFGVGFLFQLSTYGSVPVFDPSSSSSSQEVRENRPRHIRSNKKNYDEYDELSVRNDKEEPLWLQPKLFHLNFTWIQNNETICHKRKNDPDNVRILPVLVHTARSHFEERLAIRKTWGSLPIYKNWDLRFIFLLGEANNPDMDTDPEEDSLRLAAEQVKFRDIVVGNFLDTYHNLTYKHMMGYKWVLNFCHNASIVLKIDDDVFIDIIQWLNWLTADLKELEEDTSASASVPDIYCKVWARSKPFRQKSSKWYVSYKDWSRKYYPPFCSGWAYTIPIDLMEKIYLASNDIKFNWIDDVFVTGQLLQIVKNKYNLEIKIGDLTSEVTSNPEDYKAVCANDEQVEVEGKERMFKVIAKVERGEFFERDMMCMWNRTLSDSDNSHLFIDS